MENSKFYNTVIKGDYCIGCGICATVEDSPIEMELDNYGKIVPKIKDIYFNKKVEAKIEAICPFSNEGPNEDELGQELFGKTNNYVDKLGYINSTFAGYVKENNYRESGSSGGFGSWIVNYLLQENHIDAVVHIGSRKPTESDSRVYEYKVSRTKEEIMEGAKSKYYPIEMSGIVNHISENPGNYVLVGIPCFVKSIRTLARHNPIIKDRVKFTVGLVCGHLKSKGFAEMLGWQVGISPDRLTDIDFRTKLDGYGANQYGITATEELNNKKLSKISGPVNEMYGTNWGLGFFKYKACDYCDDVTAETADITIGDAWLPQYVSDYQGTNIIIVRNPKFLTILQSAQEKELIHIESLTADDAILSQSSGLFHRREGLEYRLFKKDRKGDWRPKKRVEPRRVLPEKIEKVQDLRMLLAEKSHIAFLNAKEQGDFKVFTEQMGPLVNSYYKLYKKSFLTRVKQKLGRILKNGLNG
ncbi:Coenzyme F420 hydrogenase/dehydrogenase, beta subunit C-terminal domain [Mesonia sp. HuA40]|uniref:Coenzyme F420 hydrogenase/dehydrogenase, beta subunit C-terminal domain n=1 Tax=Mesonia sp. HuA40 TaxID=2602761 RepID=UPI0011C77554|nr:Coenzyme F420 hydrogenase/dehydrogenase, beta subunit C-terminal domain [Mesonia sp. HuA40]TXK75405.1 coenzyme F420 hydrogenase [Mesonia sp. HuA40]